MTVADNKRKHTRLNIRTNVFVSGDSVVRFRTQTVDFSDGGLFIEGKILAELEVDTILYIQSAEEFDDPPIIKARVAWKNRYGAGIEYLL
jgi:hypothetical protein